jgi:hypothetical protein
LLSLIACANQGGGAPPHLRNPLGVGFFSEFNAGIVGAFLAGMAVNATFKNKPAKEKLTFFGNSFFIPIFLR